MGNYRKCGLSKNYNQDILLDSIFNKRGKGEQVYIRVGGVCFLLCVFLFWCDDNAAIIEWVLRKYLHYTSLEEFEKYRYTINQN